MAITNPSNDARNSSKRPAARTEWSPNALLNVTFMPREGEPLPVQWADVSATGAKLVLPEEFKDELSEGSPIRLRFGVDGSDYRVNARVIWSKDSNDPEQLNKIFLGVSFAFLNPQIGSAHPELWQYFNRRKAPRVSPPGAMEVQVEVSGEAGSSMARMIDISSTGVSVRLPVAISEEPWVVEALGHKFKLRLQLFADASPIEISVRAERSFTKGASTCWGMSILEEDERHLGDEVEQIEDYVAAQQRSSGALDE